MLGAKIDGWWRGDRYPRPRTINVVFECTLYVFSWLSLGTGVAEIEPRWMVPETR